MTHRFNRIASALAALVICTGLAAQADASLVNHWTFDEPDGLPSPQVLDSASGNDGSFSNMDDSNRSSDTPAITGPGRSLGFNGVDESVVINPPAAHPVHPITLPSNANWSAALWYRGTDSGTTGVINANDFFGSTLLGTDNGNLFALFAIIDSKPEFIWYDNGTASYQHNIRGTTSVDDDVWHHLAIVQHADQTMELYVDGNLEASGAMTIATPFWIDYLMVGFNGGLGGPQFTAGLIDDVRIYDHALSAKEVLFLVPEPASLTLLGLGAMAMLRRRAQQR